QELRHRPAAAPRQLALDLGEAAGPRGAVGERTRLAHRAAQRRAELGVVRQGERRPPLEPLLAVGLDQGHVDAVHRRAAHEAQRAHHLAHGRLPVLFPDRSRPYRRRLRPSNGAMAAMAKFKSDFLNILDERGFIHQCSDFAGLDALAARREVIAYVGYDCTAPSLHIGNFLTIMMLYWLQQTGNKPITLMGGGTTRVGDPSGKDETRAIRPIEEIEANKESIKGVFAKVLKFGPGKTDAVMLDNAEWLTRLNYIDMLRDVGRHFSVNRMLTMDSVRLRLEREQEMSFIEFN